MVCGAIEKLWKSTAVAIFHAVDKLYSNTRSAESPIIYIFKPLGLKNIPVGEGSCAIPTNASMVNGSLIVPFNIASTFTLLVNVGSINTSTINVSIFLFTTFESTIIILNGKNNLESTVNTFVFTCSENVSITNVSTPVFLTKASTSTSSSTPISLTTASTILVSSILSANNASDVKFFVFLVRNKPSLRHLEF